MSANILLWGLILNVNYDYVKKIRAKNKLLLLNASALNKNIDDLVKRVPSPVC